MVNVSVSQRNVKRSCTGTESALDHLANGIGVTVHARVHHHKVGRILADQVEIGDSGRKKRNSRRNLLRMWIHDGTPLFVWDAK